MTTEAPPVQPSIPESFKRADALVAALLKDSKVGSIARAKAKELFPDAGFEFQEDRIDAQLAPIRDEIAAARAELEAERAAIKKERDERANADLQATHQNKFESAISQYSLTADGAQKVLDRMKETGNATDYEAAAAWVAGQMPKAVATNSAYLGPQNLNLFGSSQADEKYALLHKDPGGAFLDSEFREFVADPDAYVRSAGFAA